jgi:hypothetical protein
MMRIRAGLWEEELFGDIDEKEVDVDASVRRFTRQYERALEKRWPDADVEVRVGSVERAVLRVDLKTTVDGRFERSECSKIDKIGERILEEKAWVVHDG